MKLFINKRHKWSSILVAIGGIPLYMAFMPYGSFNPSDSGFWIATFNSLIVVFLTNLALVKFHVPGSDKKPNDKETGGEE